METPKAASLRFALLLPVLCLACSAQSIQSSDVVAQVQPLLDHTRPLRIEAVQQQHFEYVIPELILGGEWTSTIRITNRSTQSMPATSVYFVDNLGNDMTTTFQATSVLANGNTVLGGLITGTGFSFFLAPGYSIEATFAGGANTQFGHALIDYCSTSAGCSSAGIYGEVLLRNRNSTRPDFESIFPFEQPTNMQYMLWDDRNGLSTVLYLVNENTSSTLVSLSFLNAGNKSIQTVNVTLPELGSQILTLDVLAPAIIGLEGTLVISGMNSAGSLALVTATALRINPSNSFTPMRAFVPSP